MDADKIPFPSELIRANAQIERLTAEVFALQDQLLDMGELVQKMAAQIERDLRRSRRFISPLPPIG